MQRCIVLIFVLVLTASSLMMVKPALAQTKPAVPEFTLKFSDDSYGYSVPPTYSIDTFTGKNVTTQVGYYTYVENKSVEVTIKNQPFDNYKDPLERALWRLLE